jgi:hypothetical protein
MFDIGASHDLTHNISKNWTQRIYSFWDIADLGFSHFSDFSVIFYAIYKYQQTHFIILVALLQGGPRKEKFPCNVAPGGGGRRGLAKFRRGSPGFCRGRAGEWLGARRRPVCGLDGWKTAAGGGAHRQPAAASAADRVAARVVLAGVGQGVAGKERWSYTRASESTGLYTQAFARRTAAGGPPVTQVRRPWYDVLSGTALGVPLNDGEILT